jgi:hypothetical protein
VTMHLKPGRTAAAALKAQRRLRVSLSVRFTPTGGTPRLVSGVVNVTSR